MVGQALRQIQTAWTSDKFAKIVVELAMECGIAFCFCVFRLELDKRLNKRFRDENTAVLAKMSR